MKTMFALGALVVAAAAFGAPASAAPTSPVRSGTTADAYTVCAKDIRALPGKHAGAYDALPTAPGGSAPAHALSDKSLFFNDHHVRGAHPVLTQNRALGAFACGTTVLVPIRSMFESMGGTVSYNATDKTIEVSKPGAAISLTVGKPTITLNGESRPLDVPPAVYGGIVYVPIRVVSEALGGYVQWQQAKQIVVVRYLEPPVSTPPPSAPPPSLPPPASPTPRPPVVTPSPTPTPVARNPYEHFIVGDYIFSPKVYNEFSPGNKGTGVSFAARGAVEFPAFGLPWMLEGDYRSYSYPHNSGINPTGTANGQNFTPCPKDGYEGCVTVPGCRATFSFAGCDAPYGSVLVPQFTARDTDFDGRLGLRIAEPRVYIGVGYLHTNNNYPDFYPAVPSLTGVGYGAEKLPDLNNPLSVYGSVWYYPSISGNFTFPAAAGPGLAGTTERYQQRFLKYQIGGTLNLGNSGLFLDAGFLGDTIKGKNLSPSDASHAGGFIGLGLKF